MNSPLGVPKALALSAAGHLLLAAGLLLAIPRAERTAPLALRLVNLEAPPPLGRVEGTLAGPPVAEAKPPVRELRPRHTRPAAVALAQAQVLSFAPQGRTALAGPATDEAAAASEMEVSPAQGGGGTAGEAGASLGGPKPSRLGELHRRLSEAAERCYPAAARRFRLRGEVPLRFCLDASGAATTLSLEGSTGSPLLDRSALECVVPGAQPLSGFEGCFLVPVRFGG